MDNHWHSYDTEILIWELHLPGRPSDPAYRDWERAVLDAGEARAAYRVEEIDGYGWLNYRRDRDGYLGEVLDTHPDILSPPGAPERLLFSTDFGLLGSSRLAYVDAADEIREHDAAYTSERELPDLKDPIRATPSESAAAAVHVRPRRQRHPRLGVLLHHHLAALAAQQGPR